MFRHVLIEPRFVPGQAMSIVACTGRKINALSARNPPSPALIKNMHGIFHLDVVNSLSCHHERVTDDHSQKKPGRGSRYCDGVVLGTLPFHLLAFARGHIHICPRPALVGGGAFRTYAATRRVRIRTVSR